MNASARDKKSFLSRAHTAATFLAHPAIAFYLLLWLMALLVAGTVAQKYIGLYSAQKIFFASTVIWLGGFIPVPGVMAVSVFLFISLLIKLVLEPWRRAKAGTIIVHTGVLLLLFGGFLTAVFSQEGNMVIDEGGASAYYADPYRRELAVTDAAGTETVFAAETLSPERGLADAALPFRIEVERLMPACAIAPRAAPDRGGGLHGMLAANDVREAPRLPDEEKNAYCLLFRVAGAGMADGRYAIFEDMPIIQHIAAGSKVFSVSLRRARTHLPFRIRLVKFTRETHPGTDQARAFRSEVVLEDGDVIWRGVIAMNNPLRYRGYTFYQASFVPGTDGTATVLAVVRNAGAVFPYISSIVICLGLLLHLVSRLPALGRGGGKNGGGA